MDAPIWGPDGRLVGALDVSSARADHTERWNALIAGPGRAKRPPDRGGVLSRLVPRRAHHHRADRRGCWRRRRALLVAVDKDDLPSAPTAPPAAQTTAFRERGKSRAAPRPASDLFGRDDEATGFEKTERVAVIRPLAWAEGKCLAAARALGCRRATLYRRMQRLGISGKSGQTSSLASEGLKHIPSLRRKRRVDLVPRAAPSEKHRRRAGPGPGGNRMLNDQTHVFGA